MAAQLKRRVGHKGVMGKDEIHGMISLLVVSPGGPEMKPGPSGDWCHTVVDKAKILELRYQTLFSGTAT